MKRIVFPCLFLAVTLTFASCQKGINHDRIPEIPVDSIPSKPPPSPEQDKVIVTDLMGKIMDEEGEPLEGAEVSTGTRKTFTDQYGVFRLKDASIAAQSGFITAQKSGYLVGSRTIVAEANGNGFLQIRMVKKMLHARFPAFDGALVDMGQSAQVKFHANSIENAQGQSYTGEVLVYGTIYDPEAIDFTDRMPGDLRGITADSQITALKSYGMMNVVLESPAGEHLQLAKGKKAEISMPVGESLVAGAPAEIPLWHFSEVDGKWREEGKGHLKNGIYYGEVSHFSTWNFDVPFSFVFLRFKVVGFKGVAVPYAKVIVTDKVNENYGIAFSDSLGYVTLPVPKDQPLHIEVVNECGQALGESTSGPLNADTDLGFIHIVKRNILTVSGTATACNGLPVNSGFASIYAGGLFYTAPIREGNFYLALNNCWEGVSQARIAVYDDSLANFSKEKVIDLSGNDVETGNFELCGANVNQYSHIQINKDSIHFSAPPDIVYCGLNADSSWSITFEDEMNDRFNVLEFRIQFEGMQLGERLATFCVLSHKNRIYNLYPVEGIDSTLLRVNVTEIGNIGEPIQFNFEGMLFNPWDSRWLPVSGIVRARRSY